MTTPELADRLVAVVGGPVTDITRLTAGASRETWAFRTGGRELILRRDPPGRPGAPGSMALEAAAMSAAGAAGLPVPEIVALDAEGVKLGSSGLVMTRVPGEALPQRILRDDRYGAARARLGEQLAVFLARLHDLDPTRLPGLAPLDSLADYQRRYAEVDDVSPTFELSESWLIDRRPESGPAVVTHGDLRLGNFLVDEGGLTAVIDWEFVHLGDPLEDIAFLATKAWRFGSPLEVAGVSTLDDFLATYENESGRSVDRVALHWWFVQKALQWGIGCMAQAAAHLTGANRSVELAAIGRRAAEQEWDLLDLLEPAALRAMPNPAPFAGESQAELYGRPTAVELLASVEEFITGQRTAGMVDDYLSRVAANVLRIVQRELELGPAARSAFAAGLAGLGMSSGRELAEMIRDGGLEDRHEYVVAVLATSVRDRLAVANPRKLQAELTAVTE
jgi:aminoglycoside phosphotransferase (APT) family kinase protein